MEKKTEVMKNEGKRQKERKVEKKKLRNENKGKRKGWKG